jgi:hypothetical protein
MAGLPDLRGRPVIFLWSLMRRTLIAIVLGLTVGIGIGVTVGWFFPLTTVKTTPSSLSLDWQADWILMTAQAFSLDGDLDLAKQRLALLGTGDPGARVAQRGEQAIAEGLPSNYIGALARLAAALQVRTEALSPYLSK